MSPLLWLALVGQSVSVSPPPSPGWGWGEQIASLYRQACMSEVGIVIAMRDYQDGQSSAKAEQPRYDRIQRELGEAAYTTAIDVDRLDRALQARNAFQAKQLAESNRRGMATLRRLSPADRVVYARDFAIYKPQQPTRTCSNNTR